MVEIDDVNLDDLDDFDCSLSSSDERKLALHNNAGASIEALIADAIASPFSYNDAYVATCVRVQALIARGRETTNALDEVNCVIDLAVEVKKLRSFL